MRELHVHSRGCELGKKFSAFNAKITLFGKYDSIENHYQASKVIDGVSGLTWKEVKGKQCEAIIINGHKVPKEYLTGFYYMLWFIFYNENKEIVSLARQYDKYVDIFAGKSINNQADTLTEWVNNPTAYKERIIPIMELIKKNG